MVVEKRGIVTVPRELGREGCWPKTIGQVENRALADVLRQAGHVFIDTRRSEGYDFVEADDLHFYGPFPSMVEIEAMLSDEAMAIGPKERDQITLSRAEEPAFAHYLLNANFVARQGLLMEGVQNGRTSLLPA